MVAIPVCCKKATFKTFMECPTHRPSLKALEHKIQELIEALEEIKYYTDNPFNSKDGTDNSKWLSYCQDIAITALSKIDSNTNKLKDNN